MSKRICCIAVMPALAALAAADATPPADQPAGREPATFCRYVPERSDDFAWENDLVAFRAYGPALAKGSENSGIDCWAKRVPYPIIDTWYRLDHEQKISYHADHGEGCDLYHVGRSRGCGGTAIWLDGRMVLSGVYRTWKVIATTPQSSSFELDYEYALGSRRIHEAKTITIALGQRLFRSESVFSEGGKPADLEIAVGLTTHNQHGVATLDRAGGWMAVWEDIEKTGFGTGVVMDPRRITGMQEIRTKVGDESHAVLTTHTDADGRTIHYAGFAWSRSGDIATSGQWGVLLGHAAAALAGPRQPAEAGR